MHGMQMPRIRIAAAKQQCRQAGWSLWCIVRVAYTMFKFLELGMHAPAPLVAWCTNEKAVLQWRLPCPHGSQSEWTLSEKFNLS
mmetsp:Transcript_43738/g.83997  ORF Transcript_43738/g.83997 Transcript_43738/m.83997 type:complete len:84 (-) Transcript_43738:996-1247(-)